MPRQGGELTTIQRERHFIMKLGGPAEARKKPPVNYLVTTRDFGFSINKTGDNGN